MDRLNPQSRGSALGSPDGFEDGYAGGLAGVLVLAATPIGDPRDASRRLAEELVTADVVAAEDTRRLPRLCSAAQVPVPTRTVSLNDHNEAARVAGLLEVLAAGGRVLLVSDAGMPTVSDPGYRLVVAATQAGHRVTAVPGPSAVTTALAVSGLPTDRFCFEGFLPRRAGERARRLGALATEERTMVMFEAPHRLAVALTALAEAFGADRRAVVCRELTKTHEQVRRGSLGQLRHWAGQAQVRGEITLVVAGAPRTPADLEEALGQVRMLVQDGHRLKDACRAVAAETGRPSKQLYAHLAGALDPLDPADAAEAVGATDAEDPTPDDVSAGQ